MFDTLHTLAARAAGSDVFAAGLMLGALGTALAAAHAVRARVSAFASRRAWARLTLDSRSEAYRHLHLWLEAQGALAHVRQVRLLEQSYGRTSGGHGGHAPDEGRHWFVHRGRLACYDRRLDSKGGLRGGPLETVTVALLFGRPGTLLGWIAEGRRLAARGDRTGPAIHVLRGEWWNRLGEVTPRPLGTVVTDGGGEAVLADLRRFLGARDWYAERGVPWRRGYLLHGPPGTGKSSLIRALASEAGLDLALIDVGRATLTDDDLREGLVCAPPSALIAIEDVDAAFTRREASEGGSKGVSFSGLLNALDGVAAQEGRAVVMTTNHPERLDPALVRPGRIDRRVELGPLDAAAARRLFERFFPGEPALADRFERRLGDLRVVPAAVQGWLLAAGEDAALAASADGLVPPAVIAAE